MPAPLVAPAPGSAPLTLGLCQIIAGADKAANVAKASAAVADAASRGAHVVVLPECFNSPYSTAAFPEYAEAIPDGNDVPASAIDTATAPTSAAMSALASKHSVFLVAGSIPERDAAGRLYNTCAVYAPSGSLLVKHRKLHLFDIDIPGKITFKESDSLTAGDAVTTVDLDLAQVPAYAAANAGAGAGAGAGAVLRVGVGICYDIRFPDMAAIAAQRGAGMLLYPGAFNTVTGPAHWELLQRAHAVQQQLFVATCSPARAAEGYQAWGHSTVVNPWGEVVATTDESEGVVLCEGVSFDKVREVRAQIPVTVQRRTDVYATAKLCKE